MLDSVRTRLTLWYVGVLTLVLLVFSFGVYGLLARNLERRTDVGLRGAIDSMKHLLGYERLEGDSELEAAQNTVMELRYPNMSLAVYRADGRLLAEVAAAGEIHATFPGSADAVTENLQLLTVPPSAADTAGSRIAFQRIRALPTDEPNLIVARQSLSTVNEELQSLRQVFLFAVPLAVVLAGLAGWFLARRALTPVVSMSEHARRIGADNLGERLPVANPRDELGRLASTFNELLARLNLAFDLQRQFMADASHELRTPLSVMHTTAQVTLERTQRAEAEYRDAISLMDAQTQRLARIVADMFTLARADAGHRPLEQTDFYLDELLSETVRAAQVLGNRVGVTVIVEVNTETLCRGDEGLLRQMLLNLLDNGIKHTPSGGRIGVTLARRDGYAGIVISDSGTGIPMEAQPHIFERFYRVDEARARVFPAQAAAHGNGSGAGLGLSIASWVAEAHGGSLQLVSSSRSGTTFQVELPLNVI
ncbi:MAG: heavy metal sensor histidine kinase [Acidobacteriota bacterium]